MPRQGRIRRKTSSGGPREVVDDSVTAADFDWKIVTRKGKKRRIGTRKK